MKHPAIVILVIFFSVIVITPFVELMGLFEDTLKINAQIIASGRSALNISAQDIYLKDVEARIDYNAFQLSFNDNFITGLKLNSDFSPDETKNCQYNDFSVTTIPKSFDRYGNIVQLKNESNTPLYNSCEIEVLTRYNFKTPLMKKFYEISGKSTNIRIKRIVFLNVLQIE